MLPDRDVPIPPETPPARNCAESHPIVVHFRAEVITLEHTRPIGQSFAK
jgi:hypothetical protein